MPGPAVEAAARGGGCCGKTAGKWEKTYLDVLGICCTAEVALVERLLAPINGVRAVTVVVPSRTVIVDHDTAAVSQFHIVKVLNKAGLEASVRAYGSSAGAPGRWPSPFIVACGVLLAASLFAPLLPPLRWLAVAAACVGSQPMLLRAFAAAGKLTLDINILMLIAVAGAVALGSYTEAGAIVFLFTVAEWLETLACTKASAGMLSLMSSVPKTVVLAETGQVVGMGDVAVGTVVAVRAGDVVPVDGVVVGGQSEVDESSLTGESFPVPKQAQSEVWAGTINLDGYISVRTTALAENSTVAKMERLVEEAQNSRSRTQRLIDSCAKHYTPAVVVLAAGVVLVPVLLGAPDLEHWFRLSLVLLVSACPCALVLSTPVATFCALLRAARMGLLARRRPGGAPLGAPPGGQGPAHPGAPGAARGDADGRRRHERRAGARRGGRGRVHGPVRVGGRHRDEPRHAHVRRRPAGAQGRQARAPHPPDHRRQRGLLRRRQGRRPGARRRVAPRAVGGRARRRRHVPARRAAQHAAAEGRGPRAAEVRRGVQGVLCYGVQGAQDSVLRYGVQGVWRDDGEACGHEAPARGRREEGR
ncbi:Cadmium/zinc-transporting ATPase HMA2 [Zea mays]|uniref:Cd(2+)-exporting ATPase n=1 Tax=Zea mays TaxID=4577 RepID=A0A1D6EL04_MAIZE|nr:Cadmium/zinc-transporting ATPase HMA2 [Zea mays]